MGGGTGSGFTGKMIKLEPGVSLEDVCEGDILVINGISEKVVEYGPLLIKTKRKPGMEDQASGEIELMIRQRKNYLPDKGYFINNPLPQVVRMGDEGYDSDNKDLIEVEEQLK